MQKEINNTYIKTSWTTLCLTNMVEIEKDDIMNKNLLICCQQGLLAWIGEQNDLANRHPRSENHSARDFWLVVVDKQIF